MKPILLSITVGIFLPICAVGQNTLQQDYADSVLQTTDTISTRKSIYEIRFGGWTKKDWLDNEYIRTLRKYLDDYNAGKISNPDLDPYKEEIKGKFIVGIIEPSDYGGVLIRITFLDAPRRIYTCMIYSYVDEEKQTVDGYELRYIYREEGEIDNTKEDILRSVEKYPELKLW